MRAASLLAVPPLVLLAACGPPAAAQEPPTERQIAEAVSAAPEPLRDGAKVLGWRDGVRVPLREGVGELVCLADDPGEPAFHVACYHRSLEPYMELGRRLRAAGKSDEEVRQARLEAVAAGRLRLPERPAALYSLTGEEGSFDPVTGGVPGGSALFVLYTPYATPEETGLPARPTRGGPWLMAPGTPFAHVMVSR